LLLPAPLLLLLLLALVPQLGIWLLLGEFL
jgi:hypothetical protein